jgi:hypothetical protein
VKPVKYKIVFFERRLTAKGSSRCVIDHDNRDQKMNELELLNYNCTPHPAKTTGTGAPDPNQRHSGTGPKGTGAPGHQPKDKYGRRVFPTMCPTEEAIERLRSQLAN